MRAEFIGKMNHNLKESGDILVLEKPKSRHLVKVVRIRPNEELLLLDGEGCKYFGRVESLEKDAVVFRLEHIEICSRSHRIHVALPLVKKDALEHMLCSAVELGAERIFLFRSEFSRADFEFKERHESLLISALKQSNNPFLPQVEPVVGLRDLSFQNFQWCCLFSPKAQERLSHLALNRPGLLLIGPEAGFSVEEETYLGTVEGMHSIALATPILRAPTALAAAFGHLLSASL